MAADQGIPRGREAGCPLREAMPRHQGLFRPSIVRPTPFDISLMAGFFSGRSLLTLRSMPATIVIVLFTLIMACLFLLIRSEYRRLVHSREARLFERLYNSRF